MFTTTLSSRVRQSALLLAFTGCAGGLLYRSSLPHNITIIHRGAISPVVHAHLLQQLKPTLFFRITAADLLSLVQQYAVTARAVSVRYDRHHHATITITHALPRALINTTHVLTDDGKLVPTTGYLRTRIEQLPLLTLPLAQAEESYPLVAHFITKLPADILEEYTLTWHNKTDIKLIPKSNPQLLITIWHQTEFTPSFMTALKRIESILTERRPSRRTPPGTNSAWHVDGRIPHYCIASPISRGDT